VLSPKATLSVSPLCTNLLVYGINWGLGRYRGSHTNGVTIDVYERYLVRRRGVLKRWKEEIMERKFSSEFVVLRVLNITNEVSYANICAVAKPSYIFRSSGNFRMLLQRAWQTACN